MELSIFWDEFKIQEIAYSDPRLAKVNFTGNSDDGGKEVNVNIDKNFSGHVADDVRVMDVYTLQVSMTMYVLLHPCVTCFHLQRSVTFDLLCLWAWKIYQGYKSRRC